MAVTIQPVVDERIYEDAPADPSTPSLGLELASKSSDAIKARAVARKRHGYGLAQGDVLLGTADTAAGVVHENLSFAMRTAGFKVLEKGEGDGTETVVKVRLKHFWLWLEPGVMVGTIRSRITTSIQIGQDAPWSVTAETSQPGQIFSEEAWTHAVEVALEAYRKQVAARLAFQPGNSGGPLLDRDGRVIGVVQQTLNPWRIAQVTGGALPQNVSIWDVWYRFRVFVLAAFDFETQEALFIAGQVRDNIVSNEEVVMKDIFNQFRKAIASR